jgi:hypothetical protein
MLLPLVLGGTNLQLPGVACGVKDTAEQNEYTMISHNDDLFAKTKEEPWKVKKGCRKKKKKQVRNHFAYRLNYKRIVKNHSRFRCIFFNK